MSEVQNIDLKGIGLRIRAARETREIGSLEDFADRLAAAGCERPSIAKLSRIETGIQPVPVDILSETERVLGIPAEELRPDLAAKFPRAAQAAE